MVSLENSFLYCRLLGKEKGECAHSTRYRANVGKAKNK
jgi:hypothetical protein